MKYKFPRIAHLPYSEGITNDDKVMKNTSHLEEVPVVVATIKMDGENTTLYREGLHARSLDSRHHASRAWIKKYHSEIKNIIPEEWRICGENLFAKHSIYYTNLYSYFYVFAIFDHLNSCLGISDMEFFCEKTGLKMVPIFYYGKFNAERIHKEFEKYCKNSKDEVEGYVVRPMSYISFENYSNYVAKFVRKNHVQTDQHWMESKLIKNGLI